MINIGNYLVKGKKNVSFNWNQCKSDSISCRLGIQEFEEMMLYSQKLADLFDMSMHARTYLGGNIKEWFLCIECLPALAWLATHKQDLCLGLLIAVEIIASDT